MFHKKAFAVIFSILIFSAKNILAAETSQENVKEEKSLLQANAQIAMSTQNYIVTAGDTYSLSFYSGNTAVSYTITVDPTYKIRIANLGSISCSGMTYLSLKQEIENLVTIQYPLSIISFVMLQPSVFKVTVKGEVNSVRELDVWALTRLSDILNSAGLTEFSSTRNIKITDSKGKTKVYDLFKASRFGDFSENPYLRPGDTIQFARTERKVSVFGSVERSGTYELLKNENLSELIEIYAGGTTKTANLSEIRLVRLNSTDEKIRQITYLSKTDLENNYPLADKDSVYIQDWSESQPFIEVKGIIKNPANSEDSSDTYKNSDSVYITKIIFYADENYSSFIRRNKNMFTLFSNLKNAYVQRGNETFIVEADKIIENPDYQSPFLVEKNDELIVPYKPFFDENSYGLNFPFQQ